MWTSTQVTFGFQFAHRLVLSVDPVESPIHHWPFCCTRPVMSDNPSPLKSPTCTSNHETAGLQVAHRLLVNEEPVDCAIHHWPACDQRPMMSAFPSPLKSPTL